MNTLELKMVDILKDLKDNYYVSGIKAEFEAECTRFDEVVRLKEIAAHTGLDLTIKVGGCEAVKDIYDAKALGATSIVAPMIESPYAAKKYLNALKMIFSEEERKSMRFLINIETKYGFQYAEDILASDIAQDLSGIVFGRTDMAGSLGMLTNEINNVIILDFAQKLAAITKKYNKELVIGGGVSALSLPFFKQLPEDTFTHFETRKVIFDAQKTLHNSNAKNGIKKAIDFEILWIKNKQNYYGSISSADSKRIEVLESRTNLIEA